MQKIYTSFLALLLAITLAGCAAADGGLAGTSWRVTGYNNGKEAVQSVLPDTEPTAYFAPDGTLSGNGGCNAYTSSYTISENTIRIAPPATTRKMCPQPGVMQQEAAIMRALSGAAAFRLSGDSLDLLNADGGTALTMRLVLRDATSVYRSGAQEIVVANRGVDELDMTVDSKTYRMRSAIAASGTKYEAIGDPTTVFWSKGHTALVTIGGRELPGEFVLRREAPDDDEILIAIEGRAYRMRRAVSASGAKYVAVDDPTTVFWSKGRDATLTVGGRAYSHYALIRSASEDDELLLTVEGEDFVLRRVPAASGAKYEATDDPTTVFWTKGDAATLTVRGKDYIGYDAETKPAGGETLPTGVLWSVRSVEGTRVVPNSTVTIQFEKDGSLHGKGSINSYRSAWIGTGDRILIRGAASTLMAGPQELMEQEAYFLKALEDVRGFRIRGGELVLLTKGGGEIVAERQQ